MRFGGTGGAELRWELVRIAASFLSRSYLSRLTLFLPIRSQKFFILVDNRPWLIAQDSRAAHLWQLMVTKTDTSMALEAKLMKRWEFDSIEQSCSCISSWYTGTCNEINLLREYLESISNKGDVFYDAREDPFTTTEMSDNFHNADEFHEEKHNCSYSNSIPMLERMEDSGSPYTPPVSGPYKRRKIMKSSVGSDTDEVSEEAYSEIVSSPTISESSSSSSSCESEHASLVFEATTYKDVLILFRFDDHDLPFKLKEIIMADLRLLTLLEYGLPSWVIFLQSYPVFCQIYRPWMCPLARALYVLISITTVLIGFYDLYKNVPILKATASSLFGPFFDWIESWEMISRIKYLGTILFLHNCEKAFKWFLMVARATKSLLSVLTKPIAGPIMELFEFVFPIWNVCFDTVESLSLIVWNMLSSSCSMIITILDIIIWPFWFAAYVIYPLVWLLWEIVIAPARLILAIASYVGILLANIYYVLKGTWSSIGALFQLASVSEATVVTYEVPVWRSLWNDIFSKVFRAIRSIFYGFVAFFTTCNRHRLSIYNHMLEFLHRFSHSTSRRSKSDQIRKKGRNQSPSFPEQLYFEHSEEQMILLLDGIFMSKKENALEPSLPLSLNQQISSNCTLTGFGFI
ncbi:hypothetical protein C4D60_Mb08t22890 [Musa balbisiana]|uniref:Uncharacterized protein n=1 Tax=Musa balbisiana TaxID=52838 RepID=A0A4S8K5S7_MUSBA|nr:hypothetical protein C4D60_Mb08t22890 [Musa balbisiana]